MARRTKRSPDRRRAKQRAKRATADDAVEFEAVEFEGGSVVRQGRYIGWESHFSEEQHKELVDGMLSRIPELEIQRSDILADLQEVLLKAGPAECVAAASMFYLLKDPETYRESEDDRSPAHVEFLALQALPVLKRAATAPPGDLLPLMSHAMYLVRKAFDLTIDLINLRSVRATHINGADAELEDYRRRTMLGGLGVRGAAYPEHTHEILKGCLGPFATDLRRVLGFNAEDAWALASAVIELIPERFRVRMREAHRAFDETYREIRRGRRKRALPDGWADLKPTEQRTLARELALNSAFESSLDVVRLQAAELADLANLSTDVAAAWLDAMTCPADAYDARYHEAPVGGHPVTQLPVLKLADGYFVPAAGMIYEALRPRMEDLLRAVDRKLWSRYEYARGRWLEAESAARLKAALHGAEAWTGVPWTGADDSSDIDGLLRCDDLALRIQCKAGRVSTAARRGAPSMAEDVRAVIADAAHQHARLTKALAAASPSSLGFDDAQAAALRLSLTVEVVVCLDDVTVWSTETHRLRHLVTLPATEQVPWVLSIADLMATTDLLRGAELAHFLTRRQRLEREGRVEAHDELDWVGHYIHDGLFFDPYFDGEKPPDALRLLSYTEDIDRWYFSRAGLLDGDSAQPMQTLPPRLRGLLHRLQTQGPTHWLIASLLLLNGDEASRRLIDEALTHTERRAAEVGWSNGGQVFSAYGFTFHVEPARNARTLSEMLTQYSDHKIAETLRPNWISLGLGREGGLVIVVRESDPNLTIAHALLRPDHSISAPRDSST